MYPLIKIFINKIKILGFPVVIKPLNEGSS